MQPRLKIFAKSRLILSIASTVLFQACADIHNTQTNPPEDSTISGATSVQDLVILHLATIVTTPTAAGRLLFFHDNDPTHKLRDILEGRGFQVEEIDNADQSKWGSLFLRGHPERPGTWLTVGTPKFDGTHATVTGNYYHGSEGAATYEYEFIWQQGHWRLIRATLDGIS